MDQSVINFACYEDGSEFLGMTSVDFPDVDALTQSINGAGIAGNIEAVILGHINAMTVTFHWRTMTKKAMVLSEPRRHNIDLRVAQQEEDAVSGTINAVPVKHVMVLIPKSNKAGSAAPASPSNGSDDYAVRYWKTYINGEKVREIDQANYKFEINGVDYLAPVRKALGK